MELFMRLCSILNDRITNRLLTIEKFKHKLMRGIGSARRCIVKIKNNTFSGAVTVLPIASESLEKIYTFEVFLKRRGKSPENSKVTADQIRTLDKTRIVKFIGKLEKSAIAKIQKALMIHLRLIEV